MLFTEQGSSVEISSVLAACSAKITLLIMTFPSIMDVSLACHFATVSFLFFYKKD